VRPVSVAVVRLFFIRCKSRSEVGGVLGMLYTICLRQSGAALPTASTAPKAVATAGLPAPPLFDVLHVRGANFDAEAAAAILPQC